MFTEELGAVIQVDKQDTQDVLSLLEEYGLASYSHVIGELSDDDAICFNYQGSAVLSNDRVTWQRMWSETSYRMQALRDNPECAKQEFDALLDKNNPGISPKVNFEVNTPTIIKGVKPKNSNFA